MEVEYHSLEVSCVDVSIFIHLHRLNLHACHVGTCRIGPMCRFWNEANLTNERKEREKNHQAVHNDRKVLRNAWSINTIGAIYQIVNFGWIIEKVREFQKKIYHCFIDYTKAFGCVDHNKLWKTLKEMRIQDHSTYFLRNLYTGQEETESDVEQLTGAKLVKGYVKEYCHHVYLMQSIS